LPRLGARSQRHRGANLNIFSRSEISSRKSFLSGRWDQFGSANCLIDGQAWTAGGTFSVSDGTRNRVTADAIVFAAAISVGDCAEAIYGYYAS